MEVRLRMFIIVQCPVIVGFVKILNIKIRLLFSCHAASESYSYWYMWQVAVITENRLSIWSNLKLPAFFLAFLFVLLHTVRFACLVNLLVAASCLTLHSIHVESKLPVSKVHRMEDTLWKELPGDITVKIFPWITKVPFVSSNCNISAVYNLQWNKKTGLQHSISAQLIYIIFCIHL